MMWRHILTEMSLESWSKFMNVNTGRVGSP